MPAPQDTTFIPIVRSYLLGRTVQLDQLSELSLKELELLNIETLAALQEARHQHSLIDDKQSEDAGSEYKRIKVNGYFQAGIRLELEERRHSTRLLLRGRAFLLPNQCIVHGFTS